MWAFGNSSRAGVPAEHTWVSREIWFVFHLGYNLAFRGMARISNLFVDIYSNILGINWFLKETLLGVIGRHVHVLLCWSCCLLMVRYKGLSWNMEKFYSYVVLLLAAYNVYYIWNISIEKESHFIYLSVGKIS